MRAAAVVAAIAAVLALIACSRTAHRPPCPSGALCLLLGNGAEPGTLDPAHALGVWEAAIINQMLVPLVERDADGRLVPGLAESWSVSPDGLEWTFHLRKADWSDGTPVTADDVVFAIQRQVDPKTGSQGAFMLYPVKNAEAVSEGKLPVSALGVGAPDPRTVVIRLERPWLSLPLYADSRSFQAVPRAAVERWGDDWTKPEHFLSDGPYRLESWLLGDKVVLRRNTRFYDAGHVCFAELDFFPLPDASSNERRVRSGELDVSSTVQSNRVSYLRRSGLANFLRLAPEFGSYYLTFNLSVPALRDLRVRQALAMSVDRRFITDKLLRGGETPALNFVPPGLPGYPRGAAPYWADWSFAQRQGEARRLLAAAGYRPTHRLRLTITVMNSADPLVFAPSVQADWRAVGVDAQLEQNDVQVAYQQFELHDFQVGFAGWLSPDPINYLDLLRSDVGAQNFGGYSNPRYDAELTAARSTTDPAVYAAHLLRAEQIMMADMPVAPLYRPSSRTLVDPDITGWVDKPFSSHAAIWLCRLPRTTPDLGAAAS